MRSSPSPMPDAARASAEMRPWVVDAGWVIGGLGVAQIGGDREQAAVVHHPPRRFAPALDLERHDGAAAGLLLQRQRMLGMGGQPGVIHAGHLRLRLQPLREFERIRRLRLHAHRQSFQPLEDHPGIERRKGRPGRAQELEDFLGQGPGAAYGAAQNTTLAVEILGGGMDHQIGAEFQRTLQGRRAKTVVDHQQRPAGMCNCGQRGDIEDFGQRIRRRLDEHQPGVRPHRGAESLDRSLVDETRFDTEPRQDGAEQLLRGAEDAA